MSAAPLNTEAARRTHQRRSHPILLNLTHTTRLSLCLIHIAWHGLAGPAWKQASWHRLGVFIRIF